MLALSRIMIAFLCVLCASAAIWYGWPRESATVARAAEPAVLYRQLYLAPQTGTGSFADPIRSVLHAHITVSAGERFSEVDHPGRHVSLCLVLASEATHDAIAAVGGVYRVSPRVQDGDSFRAALDQPLSTWPTQTLLDARTRLEAAGVPVADLTADDTLRTLIARIVRTLFVAQRARGERSTAVQEVCAAGLDSTVGTLSASTRQAALAWLEAKGVDTGGWTLATTIRQVVRTAAESIEWSDIRFGER